MTRPQRQPAVSACPSREIQPRLVHVAAYPATRCAACGRRLGSPDHAREGAFPLSTPKYVVVVRARVCTVCLTDPVLRRKSGVRRLALAIARQLLTWHAGGQPGLSARRRGARYACLLAGVLRA